MSLVLPDRAAGQPPTAPDIVPFVSRQSGEVIVPVTIAGTGPFQMLVDTGSSHTSITSALSRRLGLAPVAQSSLATSTGETEVLVVRLHTVSVGSAVVEELLATVLPPEAVGVLGPGVSGVIGLDFLRQFSLTLDYHRSRLIWNDAAASAAERLPLVPLDGRLLVVLPQESGRSALRFVPDSGSSGILIFDAAAVRAFETGASMRVRSLTGTTGAVGATVERLRVGGVTLRHQPVTVLADGWSRPSGGDGLLPLHLFRRVHFDYACGYMTVE